MYFSETGKPRTSTIEPIEPVQARSIEVGEKVEAGDGGDCGGLYPFLCSVERLPYVSRSYIMHIIQRSNVYKAQLGGELFK